MSFRNNSTRGFSMVELLVVMAIIGLMGALAMSSFRYVTMGSNLTTASQMLRDNFELARQVAVTKNATVEVRIYQLPATGSSTPTDYRAVQLFLKGDSTPPTYTPITMITYWPQSVVLSTDSSKTSFLSITGQPASGANPPSSAAAVSIPVYGTNYNYIFFCYKASGRTDLNLSQNWFATLIPKNAAAVNGTLPANFATVQIDPIMGKTQVFRP
jgi:uncharacterized protein (TIGR02596 family)